MRKNSAPALLLGLAALAAGCEAGKVLEVDANGVIRGIVFLDRNGNDAIDTGDRGFGGVEVRVVTPGTGAIVAKATADENGVFRIVDVPIGRYQVTVDPARLGDSVRALTPAPEALVPAQDSVIVGVGVGYPKVSVEEARGLPVGRRVFVEGTVVGAYADTAHLSGTTRSIRATRITAGSGTINPTNLPGDSVRILGTIGRHRGQPIVDNAVVYTLSSRVLPVPTVVTTAAAAGAGGGTLDAAQVQVRNATILDTINVEGEWFLRLDDGSGPVNFWLGGRINFLGSGFFPGSVVHASGVLVPTTTAGAWQIRFRGAAADLVYVGDQSPFRPAAPSGTSAFRLPTVVRVFWTDNSNNETGFRIERRTGNSSQWFEVGTAPPNTGEFVDTSAATNVSHAYRVRACNGKVCSAPSEETGVGPAT